MICTETKRSWKLHIILLLLLQMFLTITTTPTYFYHICDDKTVEANTKYQENINTLFHSLSNNFSAGFDSAVAGNGTDNAVYGLYLCRGDQNSTSCHDCVSTAITIDLPKKYCGKRREALIWYDECMVRYSDNSLLHIMNTDPEIGNSNQPVIDGDQARFMELTGKIINDVMVRAVNGDRLGRKYATERGIYTSSKMVYALAQCTPDLSSSDCKRCLRAAIGQISHSAVQGARLFQPSCNIRYDIYPFYNGAHDSPMLQISPPASPSSNSINSASEKKKKNATTTILIIATSLLVVLLLVAILATGICLTRKKNKKYEAMPIQTSYDSFTKLEFLQYDLATLQSATNNFSNENKLGEGGFGSVYKGLLPNGQEIAVKRLSGSSSQGVTEFKNEVLLVAKLQHRNLVRLLGFAFAGSEKLLVYEYVPNKSLDHFLFDPAKQGLLDWETRYKIIHGIARGLLYLHQDSRLKIIHRDLKTSNILLDTDMNPKISDFGMARLVGADQTQDDYTSKVVGTYGYMPPEYALHGKFSIKSDVYSFGVVVLEIISGKKNTAFYISDHAHDLLSYAWKQWKDGMQVEFADPTIRETCSRHEMIIRCIHLCLLCVQESVEDRPTMATVILSLESQSTTLPNPKKPAFFINSRAKSDFTEEIGSVSTINKSIPLLSSNDVSVSEIEPR